MILIVFIEQEKLELLDKTTYNRLNEVEGQDFHIRFSKKGRSTTPISYSQRSKSRGQKRKPVYRVFNTADN